MYIKLMEKSKINESTGLIWAIAEFRNEHLLPSQVAHISNIQHRLQSTFSHAQWTENENRLIPSATFTHGG